MQRGQRRSGAPEDVAFTIFVYRRMVGYAVANDDHLNRGQDMDGGLVP